MSLFFVSQLPALEIPDHLKNPLLHPFYFGVASGDPTSDRVMLWTHVTPDVPGPAEVNWQVARDTQFAQIVAAGIATAMPQKEYTLKVDATGLEPDTWYYYRFGYNGTASITGRTRTMPVNETEQMRFAVFTCADYKDGFFNAYARITERNDVDAIIHLGDYIYESKGDTSDGQRFVLPDKRCISVDDFRTRYAFYRLDPYLRQAHQQFPWYTVWDDHEFANDAWKDGSDRFSGTEWEEVKEAGLIAYSEWMPLRYPYENDSLRIYRQFDLGPSVDLIMLDVRLVGRERPLPFTNPAVNNVNRTMMGAAQKTWFKQAISASTARWKIVAQQNLMAPYRILGFPAPGTEKVWNNFPAERTELLTHIYDNNIKDVVVLTGDVHAAFANDLPARLNVYNGITGNGSAAVEFVTPSLTSGGDINIPFSLLKANNPYAFFADASNRGYMILDIVPDTVSGNFFWTPWQTDDPSETFGGSWCTVRGTSHLINCQTERTRKGPSPPLAPETPGTFVTGISKTNSTDIKWIAYPNPAMDRLHIKLNVPQNLHTPITLSLYNTMGQMAGRAVLLPGTYQHTFQTNSLPGGIYFLQLDANTYNSVIKVVIH